MGKKPIMWTDIILIKNKFHLRYKNMALKVTTQEEAPRRRPNMDPRGMLMSRTHMKNPLLRELTDPMNCIGVRLVHTFRGEERGEKMLRIPTLKILRKLSHPLLMERLIRGKKKKLRYLS
jgi:hypothetical protein